MPKFLNLDIIITVSGYSLIPAIWAASGCIGSTPAGIFRR
ncbi:hypothetical protein NOC27_3286 [Nitrosococcus oceani AFC27]|nr:hypothetical protein NOC27_3286 [Nitrosococcus oceani AFC27]